jgi:hypothetical protein
MDTFWLPLHLVFVGIWLGCVLTETLFERALLGKGRDQELILVDLHKRVDLLVEIPAFTVVLVTGFLMFSGAGHSSLLMTKIGFGLVAVLVNLYCVRLVFQRADAAHSGDWSGFSRYDHLQHRYGAVVLLTIVVALILGFLVEAQ